MNLDLSDEETAALAQELNDIVETDRYPFSPRIRTLRAILAKLRPEPAREPLPPPKVYAPPRAGRTGGEARLGKGRRGSEPRKLRAEHAVIHEDNGIFYKSFGVSSYCRYFARTVTLSAASTVDGPDLPPLPSGGRAGA